MRALAEVGEVALRIGGDGTILQFGYQFTLVGLAFVAEGFECLGFADLGADDRLFALLNLRNLFLNGGEVGILDHLSFGRHDVVIKTILNSGSDTELYSRVEFL